MARSLIIALLFTAALIAPTAGRAASADAKPFPVCGAQYNAQYPSLLRSFAKALDSSTGAIAAGSDGIHLQTLNDACDVTINRSCPDGNPCRITEKYALRTRGLNLQLLMWNAKGQFHQLQVRPQALWDIISESAYICGQYWVTDPLEQTKHDDEADATLRAALAIVGAAYRYDTDGNRSKIAEWTVWNGCADEVGAAPIK